MIINLSSRIVARTRIMDGVTATVENKLVMKIIDATAYSAHLGTSLGHVFVELRNQLEDNS